MSESSKDRTLFPKRDGKGVKDMGSSVSAKGGSGTGTAWGNIVPTQECICCRNWQIGNCLIVYERNQMHKDSKWAQEIIALQEKDGKWGCFHTLSQIYNASITTEQALRRLERLGYTIPL